MTFTYKDAIKNSMDFLAKDSRSLFLGYGVRTGTKGGGFFADINEEQLIETPVAEGLMLSMAIGLSLEGHLPVVFYERFDFIMNAMDALVNHLDKMKELSRGEFSPKVIIRCVIGGKENPFFTGPVHTQDFTEALRKMVSIPVIKLYEADDIEKVYREAYYSDQSHIIVEEKDWYARTE